MIGLALAATLMFDWTGTCQVGCAGVATVHVVVDDTYVPGTLAGTIVTLGPPIIHDAHYADSRVSVAIPIIPGHDFLLLLPVVDGPGPGIVSGSETGLHTFADGTWRFAAQVGLGECDPEFPTQCVHGAQGVGSLWVDPPEAGAAVRVPWPGLGLLVLGGLWWAVRRRSGLLAYGLEDVPFPVRAPKKAQG